MRRGIVISRDFHITETGDLCLGESGISSDALRFYSLYWDVLDVPYAEGVALTKITSDMEFLISAGVLEQTKVNVGKPGVISPEVPPKLQLGALQARQLSEPGCWSITHWGGQFALPHTSSVETLSIDVQLFNAIPIPMDQVPLEDVLEFKHKRYAELIQLRAAITELELRILQSQDLPRAKVAAIERIENAIADMHRAFNERWDQKLISSFKLEINIPTALAGMLAGASLGTIIGLDPASAAIIGAGSSALKFELSTAPKPVCIEKEIKDFMYVCHAVNELGSQEP